MPTPPQTASQSNSNVSSLLALFETTAGVFQTNPSLADGLGLVGDIEQSLQQLSDPVLQSILLRGCERIRIHVQEAATQTQLPDLHDASSRTPLTMPNSQEGMDGVAAKRQSIIDLLGGMTETLRQQTDTPRHPDPQATQPVAKQPF